MFNKADITALTINTTVVCVSTPCGLVESSTRLQIYLDPEDRVVCASETLETYKTRRCQPGNQQYQSKLLGTLNCHSCTDHWSLRSSLIRQVHTVNPLKTNINLNYTPIKAQSVPRCKHSVSVIKTSQLMLYREIIAVCSEIHTKHIKTSNVTDGAVNLQTINHTTCTVDWWILFSFRNKRDWFRSCICIIQVTIRSNALPPSSRYKYWHVFEFGRQFYTFSLCLAMNLVTQQRGQSGLLHTQQYPPGSTDPPLQKLNTDR